MPPKGGFFMHRYKNLHVRANASTVQYLLAYEDQDQKECIGGSAENQIR